MASTPMPPSFNHKINDFEIFYEKLINYFIANDIGEDKIDKRKAILITLVSEETYKILRGLCAPKNINDVSFQYLVTILKSHFQPRKSHFSARIAFYTARMQQETLKEWATRLRGLAANCKFGMELEVVLRDIFVTGMEPGEIQDRLKEEDASDKNLTLKKLLKVAVSNEAALQQKALLDVQESQVNIKADHMVVTYLKNTTVRKMCDCHNFGREEHRSEDCSLKFTTCYRCGEDGHLPSICHKQDVVNQSWEQHSTKTKFEEVEAGSLSSVKGGGYNFDTMIEGWLSIPMKKTIRGYDWIKQYVVVSSKKINFYNSESDKQNTDPVIVVDLFKVFQVRSVMQTDVIRTDRNDFRRIFKLLCAGGELRKTDEQGNMIDVRMKKYEDKSIADMNKRHQFFQIYYYNPTACDLCYKPMWHMFRPPPAFECRKCRTKIHMEHFNKKEYYLEPCKVQNDPNYAEELLLLAPSFNDQERWVCMLNKAIQQSEYIH